MNADLAQSFEADAQGYDRFRPGYPAQLFQAIIDYAQPGPEAHVLEIGAGTGQATRAMLDRGLWVDALEPGEQLAAELIKKLSDFPRLTVKQSRFEDFECPSQVYDLIFSASAFHWVPKNLAYQKAFDLLTLGGTLALCWHSFSVSRPNDPTHQALQAVFERFSFGMVELSHDPQRYQRKQNSLVKRGFSEVSFQLFQSDQFCSLEQFLGLLSTTSRFRMLAVEKQDSLIHAIQQVLGKQAGIWLDQTCDLYLGKRPAKPSARDKIQT